MFRTCAKLSALALSVLLPTALLAPGATAVRFPNGRVAFDQAPRLVRSATSSVSSNNGVTYQFTLEVPAGAGEPLKAVNISQRQSIDTVEFQANQSEAFIGDTFAGGPDLSLAAVGGAVEAGEMTVVFDPPIQPGNTVTISVEPDHNPFNGGAYLFGITAFPDGENSLGQFIGHGRVHVLDF
ncbi:MAG: DUF2808 domain-containing protein [Cyanothece sp. SIO1E1]|nr:DUF2808 domain-containing protein [Cyanothece sp. SIO1E1]